MSRWFGVALIAALLIGFAPVSPAPVAARATSGPMAAAESWLRAQQNDDGGFGAPRSDGGVSTDAALAFAAMGVDPAGVRKGSRSLLDHLTAIAPDYGKTTAGAAKLSLAASAAGLNPRAFGGHNLPATIAAGLNADGQYGETLFHHGYAVMALAAANEPVDPRAVNRIVTSQIPDGSWGFAGPGQPGDGDANTTALLVQALVAAGQSSSSTLTGATGYLKQSLAPGGGFVYAPGQEDPPVADANSTALAVQALLALDEGPAAPAWGDSLGRLARFQNASGAFRWKDDQPDDNLLASVQAIPALVQLYLPFRPERCERPPRPARGGPASAVGRANARSPLLPGDTPLPSAAASSASGRSRGGWSIFGLPLTEEFAEVNPADGKTYTVQYFERFRFEYHPEHAGTPFEVQLGLLGTQATVGRTEMEFGRIQNVPDPVDCRYFDQVGHTTCGAARAFWEANGGLEIFGLPISQPLDEGGKQVQYYERARFELTGGAVQLGLLGRELLYRPAPMAR